MSQLMGIHLECVLVWWACDFSMFLHGRWVAFSYKQLVHMGMLSLDILDSFFGIFPMLASKFCFLNGPWFSLMCHFMMLFLWFILLLIVVDIVLVSKSKGETGFIPEIHPQLIRLGLMFPHSFLLSYFVCGSRHWHKIGIIDISWGTPDNSTVLLALSFTLLCRCEFCHTCASAICIFSLLTPVMRW